MRGTLERLSIFACVVAAVLRGFEAGYFYIRDLAMVPADSLLHYHWLLSWWRHGDSMRGFTLTPSPYFFDLIVQFPIALVAGDFEVFAYAMSVAFALLIFVSLLSVMRVVLEGRTLLASVITAAAMVVFYAVAPFSVVLHAFTYNHTSEVYSTLGLVALVFGWFRPGAPRRWYALPLYAVALMVCIISSPFFIATYCIPIAIAGAAMLGTTHVTFRRLAWFLGVSVVGALAGMIVLAWISRYAWPVRGDQYNLSASDSYHAFSNLLATDTGIGRTAKAVGFAAIASVAVFIVGRRTGKLGGPALFLLVLFPATVVSCVLLPMKRGALGGGYELRYLQLPWLLACTFYAVVGTWGIRALVLRLLRGRLVSDNPLLAWSRVIVPLSVAIALLATMRGPLHMFDPASKTAETLRCVMAAEKTGGLKDGVALTYVARYVNAAKHASDWMSPHLVVQVHPASPPVLNSGENNVLWFNDGFRHGKGQLNYVATHLFTDAMLESVRTWIGPPDRTITCPTAPDWRVDGKATFEYWIWDRPEAQRRLTEMVIRDNYRSPFTPVVGARTMAIDLEWGAIADPPDGEFVRGHRVWRRGVHREGVAMAYVRPMFLPSGRYRVDIELTSVPHEVQEGNPVAEVSVRMDRKGELRHFSIKPGVTHAEFQFRAANLGGPTSGAWSWMTIVPAAAESIEISSITLTLVEPHRIDPLRIFR
jgi:hypothetical protein